MRADRLLAIIMILQAKGMMTAAELSAELEVSERTVYRDMDALCVAGFPIVAQRGQGGGFALLEDFRFELSGFNARDIQALSALKIPQELSDLGIGSALRTALLKMLSMFEGDQIESRTWIQKRLLISSLPKSQSNIRKHKLISIRRAVWNDRQISCRIKFPHHFTQSEEVILAPYSLIASDQNWFVIAARKDFLKIYNLDHLLKIEMLEKTFTRPADYDPRPIWQRWQTSQTKSKNELTVRVLMKPEMVKWITWLMDWDVKLLTPLSDQPRGWQHIGLRFSHFSQALRTLFELGGAVRVLSPESLKLSLIDHARQILLTHKP